MFPGSVREAMSKAYVHQDKQITTKKVGPTYVDRYLQCLYTKVKKNGEIILSKKNKRMQDIHLMLVLTE